MQPSKKVLLVSSGQPSLNPRLVKEADALSDAGFDVTVLYAYWNTWGTALDNKLLPAKNWHAIRVGGHPNDKPVVYFLSRLLFKIVVLFTRLTGAMQFANLAIARSSFFLTWEAKKHHADIYIGHNLGALPAVIKAAKKHGKPCGFDAEDFHRNEVSDNESDIDVKLKIHLEDKYFPQLNYLTTSSPLINKAYQHLYPQIKNQTILNTFPKLTLNIKANELIGLIKLFWFSQTIGLNRGIEHIIAALNILPAGNFELHLLGDVDNKTRDFFTQINNGINTIHFHPPIPPDKIIAFASQFDIGIASEENKPFNRTICLTNKLFTYIQAGLAIVASNTTSQTNFIKQNGVAGKLYKTGDEITIANLLAFYKNNKGDLQQHKTHNYQLGQTSLNWDTDKKLFLAIVNQALLV